MKNFRTRVNNIELHYVRHGRGAPVLLLHGWPEYWYTWHKIIPLLAENSFDVIAPDLRGFGLSEKPSASAQDAYSLDDHVNDLKALVDELDLSKLVIVSHDVGSSIAQEFARQYPDRVAAFFFFNLSYPGIGARWATPDRLEEIWYQGFHLQPWAVELLSTSRETLRSYLGNILAHWSFDSKTFDAELDIWVDNFLLPGNLQGGFNWYKAMFPARLAMANDELSLVSAFEVPTCVRWGENDPVMPVDFADRLPEYFSDLDFESVPKAGHFVHYERPTLAAKEILTFLARLR